MRTHKNQLLIVSLLLVAVLVLLGVIVYAAKNDVDPLTDNDPSNDDVINDVDTIEGTLSDSEEGFTAYATYQQNNSWMYTVQGELPNPCYSTLTDVLVAESFPEQVTIQLTIQTPDADDICAQMIQEVNIDGEYFASEDATMNLKVLRD